MEHPDHMEFALWYHDLVMKQKSRVDEERSAQAAQAVCRHALLPEEFAENVKSLILATKHAKVPSGADEKLITDIDLSIFGKSPAEFDEYVARVRKEYSYVPEDEFWNRRASILQKFLDRPAIYSTDFFNKKYEAQAQSNLRKGR
jgi:predicted metal-dependent HD superfamily phosphohydrolase